MNLIDIQRWLELTGRSTSYNINLNTGTYDYSPLDNLVLTFSTGLSAPSFQCAIVKVMVSSHLMPSCNVTP